MLRSLFAFALCAGLVACATLKTAPTDEVDGVDDPDGARSGGPGIDPLDGRGDADASGPPSEAGAGEGGVSGPGASGNGDPRWPQGPLPGDDPHASNFTIANTQDGAIITDEVTGLSWQNTVATTPLAFQDAVAHCDALSYGGLTDWRAPTRMEAVSLVRFGAKADYAPSVFAPIDHGCAWTASELPPQGGQPRRSWSIDPAAGVLPTDRAQTCVVRCVRGGPPLGQPAPQQYAISAVTVTDAVTRLVWEREPPSTQSSPTDAASRCGALVLEGRQMRLPTVKELLSITDETQVSKVASPDFGGERDGHFLASHDGWTVGFEVGQAYRSTNKALSRCVASLP